MSVKHFQTPEEVYDLPPALRLVVEAVKSKMSGHNFKFKPEYAWTKYTSEIGTLLDETGWSLLIDPDKNWVIKPKGSVA